MMDFSSREVEGMKRFLGLKNSIEANMGSSNAVTAGR